MVVAPKAFWRRPMTSQHDKAKRWRPRFSVRTLVVVVTLVCCYAACWGPTKRRGVDDVKRGPDERYRRWVQEYKAKNDQPWYILDKRHDVSVIAPLFLRLRTETVLRGPRDTYYFWFFGYVAKLPYERERPQAVHLH